MKAISFILILMIQSMAFGNPLQQSPVDEFPASELCTEEETKGFMVVLRYCQEAQFSKQSNAICIMFIDQFLTLYPAVDCKIPKRGADQNAIKPYHLTEDTILHTRAQLSRLFEPKPEQ